MGGRGYAAGRLKGGLLSGRGGYVSRWERGGLLSGRAGLCCWAVEKLAAEWEGNTYASYERVG